MLNLKRKVRYYHRRFGLYGYLEMSSKIEISETEYNSILQKLKPLKKKKGKNTLVRFGRYREIEKLVQHYKNSADETYLLKADQMRRIITKPYRLKVRYGNQVKEYYYRATIAYDLIVKLSATANTVKTHEEFELLEKEILKYAELS